MNKNKRKAIIGSDILSDELSKKIKTSYTDVDDANALILPLKKKETKDNKVNKETPKLLSKKQRKELEKKVRVKEQKSTISNLYAELAAFNKLKPDEALKSFKEDIKKDTVFSRKNLSEKVKMVSNKKLKSWQKLKNKNHDEKLQITESPDTSDFSTDEESDEEMVEENKVPEFDTNENGIEIECSIKPKAIVREDKEGTPDKLIMPTSKPRQVSFVLVDRPKSIQDARLELPILAEEADIMEAINEYDVVVLSGATGCGKTTQVPQFLYEAGYTNDNMKIAVTEPRRVAAMSMARRVAQELVSEKTNLVSYHIRYDKNATCSTRIKFMTDGVLLQEIKQDILLQGYSAVIIDEAHERSVYSDMLIGLLSIIVRARRRDFEKYQPSSDSPKPSCPLKLIIMSATLRVADFADNNRLFPGPSKPVLIELPSRQHPVHVKFSKVTRKKYLEEAFKKVVEVHEKYPEGGILVFVTGQQEVMTLCKWLKSAFPVTERFLNRKPVEKVSKQHKNRAVTEEADDELIKVNLNDFSIIPNDEESEINPQETIENAVDEVDDGEEIDPEEDTRSDIQDIISGACTNINLENPVHALPLFSLLPADKQALVFEEPPNGQRLVVVCTNVAETSLTIPGIKYVIDTGMEKLKSWDPITGISRFDLERISRSSAEQRAGRAGRMGPGYCFRLYSSAVFESMRQFSDPEICRRPIEDVVLMLRNYIHPSIPIHKFCLPTVPDELAIEKAERLLLSLGALKNIKLSTRTVTEITELGKFMSQIPLNPRFSRMLLMANQHDLLPYAVMMVSAMSVENFFSLNISDDIDRNHSTEKEKLSADFKKKFVQKRSDLMFGDLSVLLGAVSSIEAVYSKLGDEDKVRQVAETHGMRWQAFLEVRKLRKQLTDILNTNLKNLNLDIRPGLQQPTKTQFEHLRQLVLAGSPRNVARMAPRHLSTKNEKGKYLCSSVDTPVYIHCQSVLNRHQFEWVIFQDLCKSSIGGQENPKSYMRNVVVIEPEWLPIFCTLECRVEGLMFQKLPDIDEKQLPYYDSNHDCIMASAKKIFYGDRNLLLPTGIRIPLATEILEDPNVQSEKWRRWFVKFFIDGIIFKEMDAWRSKFKSVCKSDLILNPIGSHRTEVKCLMNDINLLESPSRRAICDKWKDDKSYLLKSYLEWIMPLEHETIIANWPPIGDCK